MTDYIVIGESTYPRAGHLLNVEYPSIEQVRDALPDDFKSAKIFFSHATDFYLLPPFVSLDVSQEELDRIAGSINEAGLYIGIYTP